MRTQSDSNWNVDDLTDTEIYSAIRYLEVDLRESDQRNANGRGKDKDKGLVICVCLSVALLLADFWFYWQ